MYSTTISNHSIIVPSIKYKSGTTKWTAHMESSKLFRHRQNGVPPGHTDSMICATSHAGQVYCSQFL